MVYSESVAGSAPGVLGPGSPLFAVPPWRGSSTPGAAQAVSFFDMTWRPVSWVGVVRWALVVAWWLVLVAAGLLVVVLVFGLVQPARVRVSMPVLLAMAPVTGHGGGGSARVVVVGGSLRVGGSRAVLLVAFAVVAVALAVVAVIVFELRGLVAGMGPGRPFAMGAGRRLRRIGVAVLGGELLRAGVVLAGGWWAQATLRVPGVGFRHPFAVQADVLVLGVLLVGLGAVFDVGARLQHDQDLTI